jgi:hypothetical protein
VDKVLQLSPVLNLFQSNYLLPGLLQTGGGRLTELCLHVGSFLDEGLVKKEGIGRSHCYLLLSSHQGISVLWQ